MTEPDACQPMPDPDNIFAGVIAREEQLFQRLRAEPLTEVLGIVHSLGASGGKAGNESFWTLNFQFVAWKVVGGSLQTKTLRVRRKVTDEELRVLRKSVVPDTVLRIKAHVQTGAAKEPAEALLAEIIGPDASDPELNTYTAELQKPVTCEDPILGLLTLDRRFDSYEGEASWHGTSAKVSLRGKTPAELQRAQSVAHTLWQDQAAWDERVRAYAVAKLLPLKNQAWLDADEANLTPENFLRRLALETVSIGASGSFDFWYDDGDLFWGHTVLVSGSLTEGPSDAGIHG